jgi:thiol-disulfide isomerase/thioredoxin
MKVVKKSIIIQASLLTATLLLNSGCFFDYFGDQLVPTQKEPTVTVNQTVTQPVQVSRTIPEPPVITKVAPPQTIRESVQYNPIQRSMEAPVLECTDDVNAENNCNKGLIQKTELKQTSQSSAGNEVHKLQSIQGKNITIVERPNGFIFPQYPNKTIVLEMFGKKCPHCIKEMPILNRIRNKYKGNVEVIAIQVEDKMSSSEAKSLIRRHNIHYPIIPGDTATNLQYNIQSIYGWTGILPFTLVIKDGVNEFTYPGAVSYNELNKDIQSLQR